MTCSVIIPTLNSQAHIQQCIDSVRLSLKDAAIVVVDGGSLDRTLQICQEAQVQVIGSSPGRGMQLNTGARLAHTDILFFLHSDTILSSTKFAINEWFADPNVRVGKLRVQFDHPHWLFLVYSFLARFDSFWTSFGDQGIVVRREFFKELKGLPDWPLLEDVCFFQKARKKTRIHLFPVGVKTSAERFLRQGIIRQQWKNFIVLMKYLRGEAPAKLALEYERRK